jgi:hypothetical protein
MQIVARHGQPAAGPVPFAGQAPDLALSRNNHVGNYAQTGVV